MKIITVSGPPSSGKTSVIVKTLECLGIDKRETGVVKFDCTSAVEASQYSNFGITAKIELARDICPDHYYVSNLESSVKWGLRKNFKYLVTESAGLCNRCSPHISDIPAICVIDCLAGFNTPEKIGPMLAFADVIVITKGDIVSQAEREVFAAKVEQANQSADILFINGITGQGAFALAEYFKTANENTTVNGKNLRHCMPSSICSYCSGKIRIGMR